MKSTFTAGCFWHLETLFRQVKGVANTALDSVGEVPKNSTYADVSYDRTGLAD